MIQTRLFSRYIVLFFLLLTGCLYPAVNLSAQESANARKAEEIFRKVYNSCMGPQGSSLTYKVNVIGIYKTTGTIVYKGKKQHFTEPRYLCWNDGVTAWRVDLKKKAVNIYRADDDSQHRFASMFKYDLNNFNYSYTTDKDFYILTLKVKNSHFFGVREAKVKILKTTMVPVSITVKVAFMSATVHISNFRSGNISDENFVFPAAKYQSFSHTDHR